jgi:hypothetical protein
MENHTRAGRPHDQAHLNRAVVVRQNVARARLPTRNPKKGPSVPLSGRGNLAYFTRR